jgi:hypothetical protein
MMTTKPTDDAIDDILQAEPLPEQEVSRMRTQIRTGDWVRFVRDGALVIGVVEYISDTDPTAFPSIGTPHRGKFLITTAGAIFAADVKEMRRGAVTFQFDWRNHLFWFLLGSWVMLLWRLIH